MSTALLLLRAAQLGISVRDLELLSIGMVMDLCTESLNDYEGDYARIADQEDFDSF